MTDDELREAVELARGRTPYVSLDVYAVARLLAELDRRGFHAGEAALWRGRALEAEREAGRLLAKYEPLDLPENHPIARLAAFAQTAVSSGCEHENVWQKTGGAVCVDCGEEVSGE